jgi:ferredoxin-type protein NapH
MAGRAWDGIRVMLGGEPRRPDAGEFSEGARAIHSRKKMTKVDFDKMATHTALHRGKQTWRRRRWAALITVNLLFVLSYQLDIQAVEGSLTGSRVLGFHLIDLNSAFQLMLAHKHIIVNLLIGVATIGLGWLLLGGRSFCSWACPYHLLSELAEKLHLRLAARKIVKDHPLHRGLRWVLWVAFALLAYGTGFTVYETISPTGITSRALIYGPGVALLWVGALLAFEVLYSRRAWCRYLCPIGLTYGAVGVWSPVRITYDLDKCFHEQDCRKVCLVPHVLDMVVKGRATETHVDVGPDCTRCGICVDTCPSGALDFSVVGISKR